MAESTRAITTILFDWDGTLMDSSRMGLVAFTKMFADLGMYFTPEVYEEVYSPNWYRMYEAVGLPREKWPKADELWILHYGEEPASLVQGARQAIEELSRRRYGLGVVSSRSESRVRREISELGLTGVFRVVICNEDTVNKKPHPEGLRRAMDTLRVDSGVCAYVGDSPEDMEMGRAARMFTVAVRSAYPGSSRLRTAQPDIHLESISEILDHFPAR